MTIGEQIRELRKKQNLTGVQLATRAGLNQSYLSKLERNRAGWSPEGLDRIARELHTTSGALMGHGNVSPATVGGAMVPIIDYAQAGKARKGTKALKNEEINGFVAVDLPKPEELFALIIHDNSMEPAFKKGDTVIVRYDLAPLPGDFVVQSEGDQKSTFKQYKEVEIDSKGKTVYALVPLNTDYLSLRSDKVPLKHIGTMIRHVRDYRR